MTEPHRVKLNKAFGAFQLKKSNAIPTSHQGQLWGGKGVFTEQLLAASSNSGTRSTSPQLGNMISLMKFQVAAWQFLDQSCVGMGQCSLGPQHLQGLAMNAHLSGSDTA